MHEVRRDDRARYLERYRGPGSVTDASKRTRSSEPFADTARAKGARVKREANMIPLREEGELILDRTIGD